MRGVTTKFWQGLNKRDYEKKLDIEWDFNPECRSSTVFPLYVAEAISAKLVFLSYWPLKHGNNVALQLTLRSNDGALLGRHRRFVDSVASVEIHLYEVFKNEIKFKEKIGFAYSLEVEVYSSETPKFTYPAISLVYSSESRTSVVHSGLRRYNSGEVVNDYALNLPQTGFDVFPAKGALTNYLTFCGGGQRSYCLDIHAIVNGEVQESKRFDFDRVNDLELKVIDLNSILKSQDCSAHVKILVEHNCRDIFPRFYVGNYEKDRIPTLTHSFYDFSSTGKENDVLLYCENPNAERYYDAAFIVPCFCTKDIKSSIISYASNLERTSNLLVELIGKDGQRLSQARTFSSIQLNIKQGPLDLENVFPFSYDSLSRRDLFLKFSFCSSAGGKTAKRQKFGFNVFYERNKPSGANICFAPRVISSRILSKPFSRRWGPIGGTEKFVFYFHNTSFEKSKSRPNKVVVKIFNAWGDVLEFSEKLEADASLVLSENEFPEIKDHLDEKIGQVLVQTYSCFSDSYFFSFGRTGIGGDHAF